MNTGGKEVGRAGGNIRHLQHGAAGTRTDRASILRESMRELSDETSTYWAAKNPNMVALDTPANVAWVNDGQGSLKQCTSIDEVLDYGDSRVNRVRRKIAPNSFTTTLIAAHLPKSMCVEIHDFYPMLDRKTGTPIHDASGKPMMRSRWVARDRDEAIEYFRSVIGFYCEEVLTGGPDAVHGADINFDESRPHIQIMADSFAADPKSEDEGALRVEASRMWGSHRDVKAMCIDQKTGVERMIQETGRKKMSRYQKGLRDRMIGLGYPIEADVDPERSLVGHGLDEYKETQDAKRHAQELMGYVESQQAGIVEGLRLVTQGSTANTENAAKLRASVADIDQYAARVEAEAADLPKLRAKSKSEGYNEGRAMALVELAAERAEVDQERSDARRRLELAREAQINAQRRAEETIAEAQERAAAMPPPGVTINAVRDGQPDLFVKFLKKHPNVAAGFNRFALEQAGVFHGSKGDIPRDQGGLPHYEAARLRAARFSRARDSISGIDTPKNPADLSLGE